MNAPWANTHHFAARAAAGILIGLIMAVLATAGVALATDGSGITSTNLSVGLFEDLLVGTEADGHKVMIATEGPSDIYVVHNVIDPGGHSGWHTHPGPSLITVTSGAITAYQGDDPTCSPTVYIAGEGFVDPGDGHVHLIRNEGTAVAETIAVQLLPQGAERKIDALAPGGCGF